ncbi:hypothetical protein MVES1_000834 [Malassezia vespertilionis]|uniref:uncharacterized protein n=1 Tax=Malassezia vespertilionis TaxID=2020962 RepID=UPI0024B119EE|nr:uncharacterized protein MVES1_000834 [Malassezia vespertilionis]WFD05504.1 hypothetical protein MVES1_000834 [Malassezia vespertilionis]
MAASATMHGTDVQTSIFKKLYPQEYLRRHLDNHVRDDGRAFTEPRNVSVATGILSQANGSAVVRLGNATMVTAAVHAEVAEPLWERPSEGFIVPNAVLAPLCSPVYHTGPPEEDAQLLTHTLQRVLSVSNVLPRDALVIEPGVAVWSLNVDVLCVSANGSVLDAAVLAAVAALGNATLPVPVNTVDAAHCICSAEKRTKLQLQGMPIVSTFGIVDATYLLTDPVAFEESLTNALISVGITDAPQDDPDADVFYVQEAGHCMANEPQGKGATLTHDTILEHCIRNARSRATMLRTLVHESLKEV